ncbi:endonuclease [Desulfopila sp. IMCC35006]|uniref:endonuclease/exonuclease/phosphatase family protein n=1 Tax=Desulfopila sp. IMCC35006 TaxID=2569542 RepID=UPI0010AD5C0E|nr:endonuclease/exonuclease/phosphatase family protein [Desulfopila sp. IMCC35006]TKB25911.1 endonuclease [Desulfopila sp. IMCC35006]
MSDSYLKFLTVATYNIHRCIGTDGKVDSARIANILQQIDADIVALQEVVSLGDESGGMLGDLAKKTALQPIPGLTMLEGDGHYGNALLCRIQPQKVERIDISVLDREPRGILKVRFAYEGKALVVFATHLGLKHFERKFQIRELIRQVEKESEHCCLVAGDFNEWNRWGRNMHLLDSTLEKTAALPTFPSRHPLISLDRIWVNANGFIETISVFKNSRSRVASDHLPLVAKIRF